MTVQTILPRGIRNNNPLNIRLDPENRWQGRVPPKHNSDGGFEQFQDPVMRLRAAAVLLNGQAHDALVGVVPYLDAAKWGSSPSP